jgi:hypothetical protein
MRHLTGSMGPGLALPGDFTERARGEAIAAFLQRVLALPPERVASVVGGERRHAFPWGPNP